MLNPSCDLPDSGLAPDATPVDRARALLESAGFMLAERTPDNGSRVARDEWKRGEREVTLWHDGTWSLWPHESDCSPLGLRILMLVIGDT